MNTPTEKEPTKTSPLESSRKQRAKRARHIKASATAYERYKQHSKDLLKLEQAKVAKRKKMKSIVAAAEMLNPDSAKIITTDIIDDLSLKIKEETIDKQKIIWEPDKDNKPQIAFLEAPEEEVLYAGARGGGKTDALIADPLRYVTSGNFKGLLIRKTMKRLREIMSRARKLYLPAVPGTRWKEQEKMFVFPSGATIEFGYCDTEQDLDQYIGQEYVWLGIDELTQYDSDYILETLKQSLRTTDPTLVRQVRCTANPGGPGHRWVKERFIDQGESNQRITLTYLVNGIERKITRKWIHSLTTDNTILMKADPNYIVGLHAIQNETLKRQWLYGDWDTASGAAFSEFRKDIHVVKPFDVPKSWVRFRACDWGYSSLAVCLWFAIDFDNNIYIYRELVENGPKAINKLTGTQFAIKVLTIESNERIRYGVLDVSTWAKRGHDGPSIAEEMIHIGCQWRPSDSSPGARIAGKMQIHQHLAVDEFTKKPKVFIFNTCKELISELSSIPIDDNNPEDVDTDAIDHAYDAFRYGLMSRPQIANNYLWRADSNINEHVIVNKMVGY